MYVKQRNVGNIEIASGQSGCCDDLAVTICKHAIVITDPVSVADITIDGTEYAITWVLADGLSALVTKISNALLLAGYVTTVDGPHIKGYNNEWVDSEIVVLVYSSVETLTIDSTPAAVITEACIKDVACRYEFEVAYDALTSFDIADPAVEIANSADSPQTVAGDYSGGVGDDFLLGSDLEAAFQLLYANETNVTFKRVQVIDDAANELYKVNVWLYGRREITKDAEEIKRCECEIDYTVAV